jgi:hypothetical protein
VTGDVATLMAQFGEACVWYEAGAPDVPHAGEHKGPVAIMTMLGNLRLLPRARASSSSKTCSAMVPVMSWRSIALLREGGFL